MELDELQKNWDEFGKRDPLWAVLTNPGKKDGKWDPLEFFKMGEEEIAYIMEYVDSLCISLARNSALDFGCGVGRLTQALCRYFDQCHGVDIAPSMIEHAKKYNRHGSKCRYYVNESDNLRPFEDDSFDFIYSNIVLQHIKPEYSKRYIKEFLRVLAPGGLLIFQIPSEIAPVAVQHASGQSTISEALSNSAFKAQIATQEPSFITTNAGSQITIQVKVKNLSDIKWPALGASDGKYQIRLGNHWLDSQGGLLMQDDGRVNLPVDLEPLEEIELPLTVTTPSRPGNYILELDLVQESVAWFKDKESEATRTCFQVRGSEITNVHSQIRNLWNRILDLYRRLTERVLFSVGLRRTTPRMEMHGIRKDEVLELINSYGGKIIDVQEDHWAGPSWISFRYCVTKESWFQRSQGVVG